jgi:excisionase family DNA binding protein
VSQPFGGPAPARPRQVPVAAPAFQRDRPSTRAEHLRPHPQRVPDPEQPKLLTVAEIAAELRVSKMTVYRLVHAGDLRSIRIGRSFRVPVKALEDYLRDGDGDLP